MLFLLKAAAKFWYQQKHSNRFMHNRPSKTIILNSDPEPSYWAGWWDTPSEGTFSDANTGVPLTKDMYQPWYLGEPNGDTLENCVIVWSPKDAWNDDGCNKEFCGFCELERAPDVQIRGSATTHKHGLAVSVGVNFCPFKGVNKTRSGGYIFSLHRG